VSAMTIAPRTKKRSSVLVETRVSWTRVAISYPLGLAWIVLAPWEHGEKPFVAAAWSTMPL
jgi:hypothetical protein